MYSFKIRTPTKEQMKAAKEARKRRRLQRAKGEKFKSDWKPYPEALLKEALLRIEDDC